MTSLTAARWDAARDVPPEDASPGATPEVAADASSDDAARDEASPVSHVPLLALAAAVLVAIATILFSA